MNILSLNFSNLNNVTSAKRTAFKQASTNPCLLGLHRADLAVTMNYLLNSKEPTTPPTLSHMFFPEEINLTNKYIGKVKNMLKNLTQKDKEFLKMPDCFSDIFDARVLKLRLMNRAK